MRSVNNSVETINAAATAIVTAESRVQPTTEKRRWISRFSIYWCFGSHKNSKRIGHAVLVPEPVVPGAAVPAAQNLNNSTSIVLPFIAPPSSPASFLQSDPSSGTQSPAKFVSLTSLSMNAYSPRGPANIFAIGPYAHEKQLVSPPVFSAFPTEPSTAPYTPPPESAQMTTPSSPEVPFAQLLTSSLNRTRRSSGTNQKFPLSQYEYQPYQLYPGSPGSHLISPGSAISNSGTSSPLPDKRPIFEMRVGEAPKLLGCEYFTNHKWGSRLGSGSITPDGVGLGSRLGSGSLTPDGAGLGSGSLTPDGGGPASRDSFFQGNRISEVASSLANSESGSQHIEIIIDHRVSFELTVEDVATCLAKEPVALIKDIPTSHESIQIEGSVGRDEISKNTENFGESCVGEAHNETREKSLDGEEEHSYRKQRSITLGSIKEFNFDSTKGGEVLGETTISSDWWANEKVVGQDGSCNNWTFFPMLRPGVR